MMGGVNGEQPDGLPPSPVTALATMATEQHEMFMSWVNAGFTRAEALELLKHQLTMATMMGVASQQAQGNDGD